ncbi:MAG: 30S ribosomal protein S26e [Candidatus Lokiarchaeia archaeon]
MPKKRKSGGRAKGSSGKKGYVQCSSCGKLVPRDKAKRVTKFTSMVDPMIGRELRQQGAYIPRIKKIKLYCINCAVHRNVVRVRSKDDRKSK